MSVQGRRSPRPAALAGPEVSSAQLFYKPFQNGASLAEVTCQPLKHEGLGSAVPGPHGLGGAGNELAGQHRSQFPAAGSPPDHLLLGQEQCQNTCAPASLDTGPATEQGLLPTGFRWVPQGLGTRCSLCLEQPSTSRPPSASTSLSCRPAPLIRHLPVTRALGLPAAFALLLSSCVLPSPLCSAAWSTAPSLCSRSFAASLFSCLFVESKVSTLIFSLVKVLLGCFSNRRGLFSE